MKEVVVISGKGGTGKTSVTAALAALAKPVTLVDCDVDASDLHLVTRPRQVHVQAFSGGKKAQIETGKCCQCGACLDACRFDAIHETEAGLRVESSKCEGCGACVNVCPCDAVRFEPVENAQWYISHTPYGPMIHARLGPGEDNSGKLVMLIRAKAKTVAERAGINLILGDGSPGIGCPVIASLTGASLAVVVAEPSLSGHHDALRVIQVACQLRVPLVLAVNRWETNPIVATAIETDASHMGVEYCQRIREDESFLEAQLKQTTLIDLPDAPASGEIRSLWQTCLDILEKQENSCIIR